MTNAPTPQSQISHADLANAIRFLSADSVEKANSGHPGMPMGMADVATVLWTEFLTFDPACATWPNRDRFVLSAGHGSMLLYSLLYLTGFEDMTIDQIKNFRQLDSKTAGHPEYGYAQGIETTTGPLGQGITNAVGMALGEKILEAQIGKDLIDHKVYVIASDGDLMEGISQEAISFAGHYGLNNLIVMYDDNQISIDGSTDLAFTDDTSRRFESCHWTVISIDGHNPDQIRDALNTAQGASNPVLIRCRTTIAHGAPTKAGSESSHGSPLGETEIATMRKNLNWPHAPFEIPEDILYVWHRAGMRHNKSRIAWEAKFANHPQAADFSRRLDRELPAAALEAFHTLREKLATEPLTKATRQLSQTVLEEIASLLPELIGGSADLTGSNNTLAKCQKFVRKDNYDGHYIHYGVREHGMAGIMNGLCLYGGLRPYGGTFLIFSDYLKPSLRLAAIMHQPVIYVLTHDSIGLGEDGPTHQPIEHLAALRAVPNVNVFRPADGVEVAECWELALTSKDTPSVLALTRQNIKPVRLTPTTENRSARGGYVVQECAEGQTPRVTLIATGSEVGLASDVAENLKKEGISTSVVSMPCTRLFDQQSQSYRDSVLHPDSLRVAIEAASPFGWEKYVGEKGIICGVPTFGESAPYKQVYAKFGLTVDAITARVLGTLSA